MTIPNVLAGRYASAAMKQIWSPAGKIRAERELWLAVLRAWRDLGVAVPDGVVEAYAAVWMRWTSTPSPPGSAGPATT